MKNRTDIDALEHDEGRVVAPAASAVVAAGSGLPFDEPSDAGVAQQLASIKARIAELEDTFRYMGTGHPHRETTRIHIAMLKRVLAQIDSVFG